MPRWLRRFCAALVGRQTRSVEGSEERLPASALTAPPVLVTFPTLLPVEQPSPPPPPRTLLVIDGDSMRFSYQKRSLALTDAAKTELLRHLKDYFEADHATLFMTYNGHNVLQRWSNACTEARYYYEPYRTAPGGGRGSGYPDQAIKDYIARYGDAYDRIVLVSSDSDFWDMISRWRYVKGRETVLVADAENSRSRRQLVANSYLELSEILERFTVRGRRWLPEAPPPRRHDESELIAA
jgi:hypothetical protein